MAGERVTHTAHVQPFLRSVHEVRCSSDHRMQPSPPWSPPLAKARERDDPSPRERRRRLKFRLTTGAHDPEPPYLLYP